MKRILLLITAIIGITSLNAQITLDFNGIMESTGNNVNLDRVTIENLSTGAEEELTSNFSFDLVQSLGSSDDIFNIQEPGFLNTYPNPFQSEININIFSNGETNTDLSVYNVLGQKISSINKILSKGKHTFKFTSNSVGVYFLMLKEDKKTFTKKIISQNSNSQQTALSYLSSQSFNEPSSESIINGRTTAFFNLGDVLRLTGFSGNMVNSLLLTPQTSQNITFRFADYYQFEQYLIQESQPSFVDIMFAVTDQNNLGVDYLDGSDFNVLEDGNAVSPSETFRCIKKLDELPYEQKIVLMLDNSASVFNQLPQIKSAAITLINQILSNPIITNQQIAVYSFSSTPTLIQDFTDDATILANAINGIGPGFPSTNLYGSLIEGLNKFSNNYTLDLIEEGYLIALTDGDDTQGSSTLPQVLAARGQKRVFMLGLGNEVNPATLNEIDNTGTSFSSLATVNDLEAEFEQTNLDLIQYANSFYRLNYLSPKRNGNRTLTVEIPGNTNPEPNKQIDGNFNANGFQDVFGGVFANISQAEINGIDEIIFDYEGTPLEPFEVQAVTYWSFNCPDFTWSIADETLATVEVNPNDSSKATVVPQTNVASSTVLTLMDTSNGYTKEITITITDQLPIIRTLSINPTIINSSSNWNQSFGALAQLEIVEEGDSPLINYGICWSETPNPTVINDVVIADNPNSNTLIRNLKSNTTYYAKTFAQNSFGLVYGNEIEFNTLTGRPVIKNAHFKDYTTTTANVGAEIIDDGGFPIIQQGFCWSSTNSQPTLNDNSNTINGSTVDYNSTIENLVPNTLYFVRAYATNSEGISYSTISSINFYTKNISPTLIRINTIENINSTSALFDGIVNDNDDENIIDKGFCYSTMPFPTISDDFVSNGGNEGTFISSVENLSASTTYYVRSYATKTSGTYYSDQKEFTTLDNLPIVALNSIAKNISTNSVELYGWFRDDCCGALEKGFIWGTSPNLSLSDNVTLNGPNTGSYNEIITELQENTTYFYLPYRTNGFGTIVGETKSFTTLSSDTIFTGSISLNTQQEVIEFGSTNLEIINGNISISNDNNDPIIDLSYLSKITSITGALQISNLGGFNFREFNEFNNLESVRSITMTNNSFNLINGFNSLTDVNLSGDVNVGGINISTSTSSIIGFNSLTSINGFLIFGYDGSTKLKNLSGFSALQNISGNLNINLASLLEKINTFSNLTNISGNFLLTTNNQILDLENFSNVTSVSGNITIRDNPFINSVDDFCFLQSLLNNGNFGNFGGVGPFNSIVENTINQIPTTISSQQVIDFNCN